jgi:arginase family enzyme
MPKAGLRQQIVGLRFEAPRRESNHCDEKQHVESPRAIANSKDKRAAHQKRDLTRNLRRQAHSRFYTGRDLRGLCGPAQLRDICAAVRERLRSAADTPVYLSLDIDCLDPAFAPGTGTPEPGGLETAQVMTLLQELHDLGEAYIAGGSGVLKTGSTSYAAPSSSASSSSG